MGGVPRRQWWGDGERLRSQFLPGWGWKDQFLPPAAPRSSPRSLEMQTFQCSCFDLGIRVFTSCLVEYMSPTTQIYLASYGRGEEGMEERLPRKGRSGAGADLSLWVLRIEMAVDCEKRAQYAVGVLGV